MPAVLREFCEAAENRCRPDEFQYEQRASESDVRRTATAPADRNPRDPLPASGSRPSSPRTQIPECRLENVAAPVNRTNDGGEDVKCCPTSRRRGGTREAGQLCVLFLDGLLLGRYGQAKPHFDQTPWPAGPKTHSMRHIGGVRVPIQIPDHVKATVTMPIDCSSLVPLHLNYGVVTSGRQGSTRTLPVTPMRSARTFS